jgi:hypothetical protein
LEPPVQLMYHPPMKLYAYIHRVLKSLVNKVMNILHETVYSCHVTYTHSLHTYGRPILMRFIPSVVSVRRVLIRTAPHDCAYTANRMSLSTVRMLSLTACEIAFLRSFSVARLSLEVRSFKRPHRKNNLMDLHHVNMVAKYL